MPQDDLPIVLACSGCSFAGALANRIARELDRRGIAEMSCLAGVAAQRPHFTKQIASRAVWVIDGCPIECGRGILALQDIRPEAHIRLDRLGVRKNSPPQEGVDMNTVIAQITSETTMNPIGRNES
jgi:uncharacterized metal-binding protein